MARTVGSKFIATALVTLNQLACSYNKLVLDKINLILAFKIHIFSIAISFPTEVMPLKQIRMCFV